jgi:hypothetical protein
MKQSQVHTAKTLRRSATQQGYLEASEISKPSENSVRSESKNFVGSPAARLVGTLASAPTEPESAMALIGWRESVLQSEPSDPR